MKSNDQKINSLQKLIRYYEYPSEDPSFDNYKSNSGICNFNNVETADRKLIINNKLQFFVHDSVLNANCNYLKNLNELKDNEIFSHCKNTSMEIRKITDLSQSSFSNRKTEKEEISNSKNFQIIGRNNKINFNIKNENKDYSNTYDNIQDTSINSQFQSFNNNDLKIKNNQKPKIYVNKIKDVKNKYKIIKLNKKIKTNNELLTKTKKLTKTETGKDLKKEPQKIRISSNLKIRNNISKNNIIESKHVNNISQNIIEYNKTENFTNRVKITKLQITDEIECKLIFDVLIWIYTKDKNKLKKFSKDLMTLLHLLSIGYLLKMKEEYFNILLSEKNTYYFNEKIFASPIWSKNKIPFHILIKILFLIKDNYQKVYSLLSWLKTINLKTNKILSDKKTINESLKSKECFLVRNYIKKKKLIYFLSKKELVDIKNNFKDFIDCLDICGIFDTYIINSNEISSCNRRYSTIDEVKVKLNSTQEDRNLSSDNLKKQKNKIRFSSLKRQKYLNNRIIFHRKKICKHLFKG